MIKHIESAIFPNAEAAARALDALHDAGVERRAISVLRRGDEDDADAGDRHHADSKASGAAKGAGIGAGVGAIAGLTALAIPGVGPFLALGGVAEAIGLAGSAAASSAVVGAAAGGLSGALLDYGVSKDEVGYYDRRIREGGIWIGVETSEAPMDARTVRRLLADLGGETADTTRAGEQRAAHTAPA